MTVTGVFMRSQRRRNEPVKQFMILLTGSRRPYRAQDDGASPPRHYEKRSFVIIQCLVSEFIGLDTVVKPR